MSKRLRGEREQQRERERKRRIKAAAFFTGLFVCLCIYLHYEMALRFVEATSAIYGICELLLE